jgi:hypothetical protein
MDHPLACETSGDDRGGGPVAEYVETIELLQEEVARLEQELRGRDRGPSATPTDGAGPDRDRADAVEAAEAAAAARAEVARLESDLAAREETIGLLMDHLGRVEEAQAAGQAEWEQLSGWLAELERRVEGQDGDALLRLEERLAAEQRRADEARKRAEQDRRDAEAQRRVYEAEIARLRAALGRDRSAGVEDEATRVPAGRGPDSEELESLRADKPRLRAGCEEQAGRPDAEALAARLAESMAQRDALRSQLDRLLDERRREQLEHAATVAELQTRLSRASLVRPEPPEAAEGAPTISPARDEQLRFQALREHLIEIHQREQQERRQRQLIPRLSRLWSRTGPR